jgi:hypothetical protein
MALHDYQPERREVIVNKKPLFQVQGLSLDDLSLLVRTHLPDLENITDILMGVATAPGASLGAAAISLVSEAPGLVANTIAVASGEQDLDALIVQARRLPFPVQVDALEKILDMTFQEVGGVKKFTEIILQMWAKVPKRPIAPMRMDTPPS